MMDRKSFLDLPPEIREQVYSALYSSTTLTYPHFGNPLATVSKRLRTESVLAYYHNVHLSFPSTKALVDYLYSISSATLRELRHISVRGHPFPIITTPEMDLTAYGFCCVLSLFPGLKLSTLEVKDTYHQPGTRCDRWGHDASYNDVEELIESDGFRELIYVSTSDRFLKYEEGLSYFALSPGREPYRDPQPSSWDMMIKRRDGAESGAEARIYRITKEGPVELKVEFETERSFDWGQSAAFDEPIEVHIKRGEGVDYTQAGKRIIDPEWELPLIDLFKRFTWDEIKQQGLYYEVEDSNPCAWL